jgi:hypothetical protein
MSAMRLLAAATTGWLLAMLGAAALPSPATAAPYTVWSCRDADGNALSARAWVPAGNTGTRADTCLNGGSLSVALSTADIDAGAISGFRFRVPRGVTPSSYTGLLAAETSNLFTTGSYVAGLGQGDELSVPTIFDGCNTGVVGPCAQGSFSDPFDPANDVGQPIVGGGLALLVACVGSTGEDCDPDADPPARASLFRSAVTLDDPSTPEVGSPGGTIAVGRIVSGTRSVTAPVTDEGSGVLRTELLVDGAVVDRRDGVGTCTEPFTVADPCPRGQLVTFVLDTTRLRTGIHTVAVRAYDAARNAAVGAPLRIAVDNTPPRPPAPPPPAPLTVRLQTPERVRLPARRVTGTALAPNGAPRPGVAVRFERRAFGDRSWSATGRPATTSADGSFALPVPRESTQIRVLADSATVSAEPAVVDFVRALKVSIAASDRRLRNRQRLTLRGRVRYDGNAFDERTALIQAVVRGRWRTVDSVKVSRRGRIRWRYRFTNTRQSARYRFRFVLPKAKRLPWKKTVSKRVAIVVRPR